MTLASSLSLGVRAQENPMSQMGLPRGKHEADQFAPVFTHLVQKALNPIYFRASVSSLILHSYHG